MLAIVKEDAEAARTDVTCMKLKPLRRVVQVCVLRSNHHAKCGYSHVTTY